MPVPKQILEGILQEKEKTKSIYETTGPNRHARTTVKQEMKTIKHPPTLTLQNKHNDKHKYIPLNNNSY